ncbi:MAG: diadenylate cyclase CdaA [Clostridia bacterium]|nr:diadenylate cyclase CdaA [Clostridia bacterium]
MEYIVESIKIFYETHVVSYFNMLAEYPIKIVTLLIDLAIVFYLVDWVVRMIKGTRAMTLLKGIIVLMIATALSEFLSLNILHYILSTISTYGVVMVIVIFQPELRRTLEQMGSTDIRKWFDSETTDETAIDKVVASVYDMAKTKTGALIVFEREMNLESIVSTGVPIEAKISKELIENIFVKDTPLHDGALIIKNSKLVAASCILPITNREDLDREYGTRHRAAIGLSEQYDAIVVVVSEETGKVSLVIDGKIIRGLNEEILKKELKRRLERKSQKAIKEIIEKQKHLLSSKK